MLHGMLTGNMTPLTVYYDTCIYSNDDDPTPHYNSRNDKLNVKEKSSFSNKQLNPPLTDYLIGLYCPNEL